MNILGIDTSSENLSLSIMWRDKILVDFNQRRKYSASRLVVYLEKYLRDLSLNLKKLDALVVGNGPGSFTGLRISFSIIKALSFSLNKPVISIGSFFSCAYPFIKKEKKIAVISDARRSLIYAASFKVNKYGLKMEGRERLVSLKDFIFKKRDYFFITYDEAIRRQALELDRKIKFYPQDIWPRSRYLLEIVKTNSFSFTPLDRLEPGYIYPKTCQIKR